MQEQSNDKWQAGAENEDAAVNTPIENGNTPAVANFTFTYWMVLAGDIDLMSGGDDAASIGLKDCQFFSGEFWGETGPVNITNTLFERVWVLVSDVDSSVNQSDVLYNNLFVGGVFDLWQVYTGPWTLQNNLFDQATFYHPANTNDVCGYNGYVTTNFGTLTVPPMASDVVLTASPAYEDGRSGK